MKIMKRNIIAFFICILFVVGVKSNSSSESFAEEIERDTCSTASYVYNSNYTKACRSLTHHSSDIELMPNNINVFLCLAVFDLSYKICYLDSRALPYDVTDLSNNVTNFNERLSLFSAKPNLVEYLCKLLQNEHSVAFRAFEPEISQLNTALKDSNKCIKICTNWDGDVNLLCILLAWADDIFTKYDDLIKLQNKEQASNVTAVSSLTANQTRSIDSTRTEKHESQLIKTNGSIKPGTDKDNPLPYENISRELTAVNTLNLIGNNSHLNNEAASINKNVSNKTSVVQTSLVSRPKEEENTVVKPSVLNTTINDKEIDNKGKHLTNYLLGQSSLQQNGIENVKKKKFENKISKNQDDFNFHQEKSSQFPLTDANARISKPKTISDDTRYQEDVFNEENYSHNGDISPNDLREDTDLAGDIDGNANQQLLDHSDQMKISPRYNRIRYEDESHFFAYLMALSLLCIGGYVGYHNKQKILAIVLEGRRSRSSRNRRRPSTASYRKLDCTLEEAVTSQCNSNVTHVIY